MRTAVASNLFRDPRHTTNGRAGQLARFRRDRESVGDSPRPPCGLPGGLPGGSDLERNPYEPPTATLEEVGTPTRPAIGWRLYWGFLILTYAGYPVLGLAWIQAPDVLDILIGTTSLAGLFGYAFQRRIGVARFWRRWLLIAVAWDVFYELALTPMGLGGQYPGVEPMSLFELVIVVALILPLYIGLHRYGSRSDALWRTPWPSQAS